MHPKNNTLTRLAGNPTKRAVKRKATLTICHIHEQQHGGGDNNSDKRTKATNIADARISGLVDVTLHVIKQQATNVPQESPRMP